MYDKAWPKNFSSIKQIYDITIHQMTGWDTCLECTDFNCQRRYYWSINV